MVGSRGNSIGFKQIRLREDLKDYIEKEAHANNVSFQEQVANIFEMYREKYSSYEAVKPVAMYAYVLTSLLENVPENKLEQIGIREALQFHKYAHFVFNNKNRPDAIHYCLKTVLPTSGWFRCQATQTSYTLTHDLGPKWTKFLSSFLSTLIEYDSHQKPSVEVEGEKIILTRSH